MKTKKTKQEKYYNFINRIDDEVKPILQNDGIEFPYLTDECIDSENANFFPFWNTDDNDKGWDRMLQSAHGSVGCRLCDYGYEPSNFGVKY